MKTGKNALTTTTDGIAGALPPQRWHKLGRPPRYEVKTTPRRRPEKVKERIVREREFETLRLQSEEVAGFEYQPAACTKRYVPHDCGA